MAFSDRLTDMQAAMVATDKFGTALQLYVSGDGNAAVDFNGIWDVANPEGTNEVRGDGAAIQYADEGDFQRETVFVECLASVDIDPNRRPHDVICNGAECVTVVRLAGEDDHFKTWLCSRRVESELG